MSSSSFPIRCFSCGKQINSLWKDYKNRTEENGEDAAKVLDSLYVGRMCCRRMFMTHVDLDHIQMLYPSYPENVQRIGITTKNEKPKNFTLKKIEDDE